MSKGKILSSNRLCMTAFERYFRKIILISHLIDQNPTPLREGPPPPLLMLSAKTERVRDGRPVCSALKNSF